MNLSTVRSVVVCRSFSTSSVRHGKRNFRKFPIFNKRGTKAFKEQQTADPAPDLPLYKYGVREVGFKSRGRFVPVPEMIPELMVPDLTGFELKPYVSYRAPDVMQSTFTAKDLFDAVYSKKITEDLKQNKLDAEGNPLEPSPEESLQPDEAFVRARQTGGDLFTEDYPGRDVVGQRKV